MILFSAEMGGSRQLHLVDGNTSLNIIALSRSDNHPLQCFFAHKFLITSRLVSGSLHAVSRCLSG
jgi:hypothetical protein